MGYWISVESTEPESLERGEVWHTKVGLYGSQDMAISMFLAAYAVDGRAESKRVCGWLEPYIPNATDLEKRIGWLQRLAANTGRHYLDYMNLRNRPALVTDLLACGEDGAGWIMANPETIEMGLKFKPVQDPDLEALVEWWTRRNLFGYDNPDDPGELGTLGHALVERLADVCEALLPHIEPNPWYDNCSEIAAVFRTAADRGLRVCFG